MNEQLRQQISAELNEAEKRFCSEHLYGDLVLLYDELLDEEFMLLSTKYSVDVDDVREIWMDNVVEQI